MSVGGAAVDAPAGVQHQLAQVLLLGRLEGFLDLGVALGELGLQRLHRLAAGGVEGGVALVLVADGHGRLDLLVGELARTRSTIAGSLAGGTNSRFGLPTAARSFSCRSMSGCAALWANISASTITSSPTSAPPPSTITMASRLAATIRSSSDVVALGEGRVDDELAARCGPRARRRTAPPRECPRGAAPPRRRSWPARRSGSRDRSRPPWR